MSKQQRSPLGSSPVGTVRSPLNLYFAAALLVSGAVLLGRGPALAMLPGIDGCLTAGIVGVLLALLHGVPYRTALLSLAAPIVVIQIGAVAATGASFYRALGIELFVFGLFGMPLSRLPARSGRQTGATPRVLQAPHPSTS